jgi:hypothetical protein
VDLATDEVAGTLPETKSAGELARTASLNNITVDPSAPPTVGGACPKPGNLWFDSDSNAMYVCLETDVWGASLTASGSGDITDVFDCASGDCSKITASGTDKLDFDQVAPDGADKGIYLPTVAGTACAASTEESQICWDSTSDELYVGDGTNPVLINGALTLNVSGTAVLGTSSIGSGACATVVTESATGAATTDVVQWNPNADISGVTGYAPVTTGGLIIYPYVTTNNVNFKVCNPTANPITPGAVTLNWRVHN